MPSPAPSLREPIRPRRFAKRAGRAAAGVSILAVLITGCGGPKPPEAGTAPQAPAARPLAALATQPVALVPAQYLRAGDSTSGVGRLGPAPQVLAALDSAIAAELAARGTGRQWIMADALTRSAKRNPAFTSDPHALSAESLRAGARRSNPRLGEPLASQVRSLVALTEARFALVPAEIRFEKTPPGSVDVGGTTAILRLVLIDARLAEIRWTGDVVADVGMPATTTTMVGGLARRVVDLLVAP